MKRFSKRNIDSILNTIRNHYNCSVLSPTNSLITRLQNEHLLETKRYRAEHAVLGKIASLQFSSSDSDIEKKRRDMNQSMLDDEIFAGPLQKNRFGVLKALAVIVAGIYCGALFAAVGANMLEELEIFVRDDDDEDD